MAVGIQTGWTFVLVGSAYLAAATLHADVTPSQDGAAALLTPINEMTTAIRYKGQAGGLYGEGNTNSPPAALCDLAAIAEQRMRPLDPAGRPAPDGAVVLMAIGNADACRSFEVFKKRYANGNRGGKGLLLVNGAADNGELTDWVDLEGGSATKMWAGATRRLNMEGASTSQVQAVWILLESAEPGRLGAFPLHVAKQVVMIRGVIELAKARLPRLQMILLSSGVYRGYAKAATMTEPFGYEGAFAVRQAVLEQAGLSAAKKEAGALAVLWGPYLWADGGRKRSDGLCWLPEDFDGSGRLLSDKGAEKIAGQLEGFLTANTYLKAWVDTEPTRKDP